MKKETVYLYKKNYRYFIKVVKESFRLYLFKKVRGEMELVFSCPAGIGRNLDMMPKIMEGDCRTPEGLYYICQKEILDPGSLGTRWLRITYPSKKDVMRSFSEGVISFSRKKLLLDSIKPGSFSRIETPAGFGIGIHGTDEPETVGTCCSSGCIRLLNSDVEKLYETVPGGTRVLISRREKGNSLIRGF
ncbi:MAG: L,D-transpeptidase [Fibrobacterota bacterium]